MNRLVRTSLLAGIPLGLAACATDAVPPSGDLAFPTGDAADQQLAESLSYEAIEQRGALLAGVSDLNTTRVRIDELGMAHVRMQQSLDGVPVFGGESIVHLRRDGSLASVTDTLVRDLNVDTRPDYDAAEAIELAVIDHGGWSRVTDTPEADLWILRHEEQDHLVWRVQIRDLEDTDTPSMPVLFMDAHSGDVVWSYDNLQTVSLSDSDKVTYDMASGTSYSRATVGSSSDSELNTTHTSVGQALAFLSDSVGRDSYNGGGAVVKSYGHYSRNYVNAFWDGTRLTFGDGDDYYSTYLGVLDVAAHELGHGVTSYEANLTYANESGALNEGASDIMAAAVEAYVDGVTGADTWDIGEDCWIEPGTTALRYMDAPSADGYSRDHYSTRYTGSSDSGGVHWNSGIANHFFYLLSEGGQHHTASLRSGYTVTGIGIDQAWQIWYRALANYMTASTNFSGARTATESACADLYDATTCSSVSYAWYEVGVGSDPAAGGGGDTGGGGGTAGCPSGYGEVSATLSGTGDYDLYTYSTSSSGTHNLVLIGPSGTDFDLYLQKYSKRRYSTVSSSTSATSDESISYYGGSGSYQIRVDSYSGSGSYTLCYDLP